MLVNACCLQHNLPCSTVIAATRELPHLCLAVRLAFYVAPDGIQC